jgi:hypothetical protein
MLGVPSTVIDDDVAVAIRVIRYKIHAVENWMNFSAA